MKRNVLVAIRDGRIRIVKEGASRGDAKATFVPVLDLSAYTCLPGLIDMHTHLTDRPEDTADLTIYYSRPAEETLRLSKENAAATVLAGFTSVRNVGTYSLGSDTALRDVINTGKAARAAHAGQRTVSHDSERRWRSVHPGFQRASGQ